MKSINGQYKMKQQIRTVIITLLGVFFITITANSKLYAWTLFDIMTDQEQDESETLDRFDPEKDIMFLPKLGNKDLFAAIDDMSISRKKEVRKYLNLYLSRGRNFTIRGIERSFLYKDTIDQIFAENPDIPADLAFLPLLESCYNPTAVSRSKAMGLWQFMRNTSEPLGLQSTQWIDDRCSVTKSTEAAVRHLRTLYKTFGSWELALAAYNGGGGHVRRAMEKTDTWNFWSLLEQDVLHRETSEYVPRFIALLIICKNQEFFGIAGEIKSQDPIVSDVINLKHPVPLTAVSRFSGISVTTIRRFNPELRSNATPPGSNGYELKLPPAGAQKLESNIESLYKQRIQPAKPVKTYKIKKGDTLSSIAVKHKTTTTAIRKANGIKNADKITPGRTIKIPR